VGVYDDDEDDYDDVCMCVSFLLFTPSLSLLQVDRSSNKLLPCLFSQLNSFVEVQSGSAMYSSTPFCVHRVKVTFTGEPGEGSGVLRSLFTAVGEVGVVWGVGCV